MCVAKCLEKERINIGTIWHKYLCVSYIVVSEERDKDAIELGQNMCVFCVCG